MWFGDSHADHWGGALDRIANENDWRIERITAGACGSFLYPTTGNPKVPCPEWREQSIETIRDEDPDLIVLSNHTVPAYERSPDEFADGVRDAIVELREIAPVVILSQNPQARREVPSCLAVHLDDAAACEPKVDAPAVAAINAEMAAIAEEEGATFVDMTPWFCTEERCPVITANILIYSDQHHLTREFVVSRAGVLDEALRDALATTAA
jgi:hypothetical protein